MDQVIDGLTLHSLLSLDEVYRMERTSSAQCRNFTPAQRNAISAHWSAELRKKIEASRKVDAEQDRLRVLVDLD